MYFSSTYKPEETISIAIVALTAICSIAFSCLCRKGSFSSIGRRTVHSSPNRTDRELDESQGSCSAEAPQEPQQLQPIERDAGEEVVPPYRAENAKRERSLFHI
jgi:hypothetical protein